MFYVDVTITSSLLVSNAQLIAWFLSGFYEAEHLMDSVHILNFFPSVFLLMPIRTK